MPRASTTILQTAIGKLASTIIALCLIGASASQLRADDGASHAGDPDNATRGRADSWSALPALLSEHYPQVRALLAVQNNCPVFEYYGHGVDAKTRLPMRSMTKSVLSLVVGAAIDKGYLALDQKLSDIVPELVEKNSDPRVPQISIRDLLTLTAEFDPPPVSDPQDAGMLRMLEESRMENAPGAAFFYDEQQPNALSMLLTHRTRRPAENLAEEYLFAPMGIVDFYWERKGEGYSAGPDGLWLTAPDMAKIGVLALQRGRWNGKQLVSSDFVADATAKHNEGGAPVHAAYGYLWWVKKTDTGLDAFFAAGVGSKLIYVVPSLNLVLALVSTSSGLGGGSVTFVNDVVLPMIENAPDAPPCAHPIGKEPT
jgi:CubicO group peptidase (beta-lactamase class C family)